MYQSVILQQVAAELTSHFTISPWCLPSLSFHLSPGHVAREHLTSLQPCRHPAAKIHKELETQVLNICTTEVTMALYQHQQMVSGIRHGRVFSTVLLARR